jgi:hypothetical protein
MGKFFSVQNVDLVSRTCEMAITKIRSAIIYNENTSHSSAVLPPSGCIYCDSGDTAAACQGV